MTLRPYRHIRTLTAERDGLRAALSREQSLSETLLHRLQLTRDMVQIDDHGVVRIGLPGES